MASKRGDPEAVPAGNAQRVPDDLKVSVIVPVYNPGQYLQRCIDSIVGQSLPSAEYEAIFVDDGSTDDSPARLDDLAARIRTFASSTSPTRAGREGHATLGSTPREGKYVYFVDHDDALGPEALERLYAFAEVNRSDIVIGKVAGRGRGAPRMLFLRTRGSVTLDDAPLMTSLAPHKLYRAFLNHRGIRFPEGRRRMEDMVFVAETYFAANVISILADYTCYYHLARHDRANAARGTYDPAGRFDPAWSTDSCARCSTLSRPTLSPARRATACCDVSPSESCWCASPANGSC